jgi:tRNA (guanine9-N1)-methyltransferase
VNWVETRDWEQALSAVMPQRKFNAEGRKRRKVCDDEKKLVVVEPLQGEGGELEEDQKEQQALDTHNE